MGWVVVPEEFWVWLRAGESVTAAARAAGLSRATACRRVAEIDVEAPQVPTPPISPMGHLGPRHPSAGQRGEDRHAPDSRRQPTTITISQTLTTRPSTTALPPSGPHLVIPGVVVPDRRVPELPAAPKALPAESKDHE